MSKHNADNERIKRRYLDYLHQARGFSDASLDGVAKALDRFEAYTNRRDFRSFRPEQAKGFKAKLALHCNARTGERLGKSTLLSNASALRAFFGWLAGQPGYRSRLRYSDADYFNLSDKDVRTAKARRERPCPTVDQISHVLRHMPSATDLELRNRALLAFVILTGARDGAVASLKLKHVNLEERKVYQDPREVRTKASKSITSWFFPGVGTDAERLVREWVGHLREARLFSDNDPLFPATEVGLGPRGGFQALGLSRKHWASAEPIRRVFREAFKSSGLPYFNPHSFRTTLGQLGERMCASPEAFKAWSQNLGHEQVLTTLTSYGQVAPRRQAELLTELGRGSEPITEVERLVRALLATDPELLRNAAARHGGA